MANKEEKKATATYGLEIVNGFLGKVKECALVENTPLTDKEVSYAVNIISSIDKNLKEKNIAWRDLDVVGCRLPQQIKRFARLGLSLDENEIFLDIRNNGKTNLKDINIKKQYQGKEKEIIKFCNKKVVRFYKDVVCKEDDFVMETDFTTGLQKVVKHSKNLNIDRNSLDNIIGAYEIAYCEENGQLNQYLAYIDRNRIMRAYNCSPSREKTVWNNDTQQMVLKTATHVLYDKVMKPFMNIPTDLLSDWRATQDELEFEENKNVSKSKTKVDIDIDLDDIVDVDYKLNNNDEVSVESEQ